MIKDKLPAAIKSGEKNMPANTLVGVFSLYKDEYLVEMEAVAVIDNK